MTRADITSPTARTASAGQDLAAGRPTPAAAVDEAVGRAALAAPQWGATLPAERARVLRLIADALDEAGERLIPLARSETNLGDGRLRGELRRTTFQLRLFGSVVEAGGFLGVRIDHPDPDWPMGAPRPDLRRMLVPVGPVEVFAAGNFPFAFSVAGGDTASALAAGCPVVVKTHPGHPGLSAATADVTMQALSRAGLPDGVFAPIAGVDAGVRALRHPLLKAAAFTGSTTAGRALFDIAAARPEPIPFYGELGSVNPTFVTRSAARERAGLIGDGLVGSFSGSGGQLCTKPGVVVVPAGSGVADSVRAATMPAGAPLLNDRIHDAYLTSLRALDGGSVELLASGGDPFGTEPAPTVLRTSAAAVLAGDAAVLGECFGPVTVLVEYDDDREVLALARSLEGQLTATIQGTDDDAADDGVAELVAILTEKAGRLLWNEWPTGVSVTYAQQHGGPYPASTTHTTSVGTAAIERFLRPVAYQNMPERLLPEALRESNPLGLPRLVDGKPETPK